MAVKILIRQFLLSLFVLLWVMPDKTLAFNKIADSLYQNCARHIDNLHLDSAFVLMCEFDKIANSIQDNHDLLNYYSLKANLEGKRKNYMVQMEFLIKYEKLSLKLDEPELIALSNLGYAGYYEQFNNYYEALPYFLKALEIFSKLKNEVKVAYSLNKLGLIYYADLNYPKAKNYFIASLQLLKKHEKESIENAYWIQNNLSNIGLCFQQMKQPKKALAYFKVAFNYIQTAPFNRSRAAGVIMNNMGIAYLDLGNYRLAEKYLKTGISTCFKPGNQEERHGTKSMLYLSDLYIKTGRYSEAESQLKSAYECIISLNYWEIKGKYLERLAQLNFKRKNYEAAYQAINLSKQFQDSVDLVQQKSIFSKQFLLYDLEKQKITNELLSKENDYKELINKVIIAIILIFIVLTTLVSYSLVKYKDRNNILNSLNKQISEQKNSLELLNKALERAGQNKTQMLQSVAHDLRSPIGSVISLNELLNAPENTVEEIENYQKLIESRCLLALNIIDDILDQSLIERGTIVLNRTLVDMNSLIRECVQILNFSWESKQISINLNLGVTQSLEVDEARMKRVLLNIIMNAIKFNQRNAAIEINLYPENKHCVISIKDHGIGMNKEILSQIFNQNHKVGRAGSENEKSIGIGLYITKSIVELHGGKIKVESQPDYGSTFYVEIPV